MVALSWCFGFPYAPNEQIRADAWDVVSSFYAKHFPEIPHLIHSATPVGERFLRAKTRNELVRMAGGYDLIVLIDADTLIHPDGIRRMIDAASKQGMYLGKPFLKGVNLQLAHLRATAETMRWPHPKFNDPGAAWVIRPETWWATGGMDENFRSWGGEDEAFNYMLTALGGSIEYDVLPAVKAHHKTARWFRDPEWSDTWERSAVYRHI